MKIEEKDQLRSLFQEMKLDEPSAGFESRLIQRIHIADRKQERKKNIKSVLAIIGGIVGILGIPTLIFWYLGFFNKEAIEAIKLDFTIPRPDMHFDLMIISIAVVALFLLISDTLIRKKLWAKKNKEEESA